MIPKILCVGSIKNIAAFNEACSQKIAFYSTDNIDDAKQILEHYKPNFVVIDALLCDENTSEIFKNIELFAVCKPKLAEINRLVSINIKQLISEYADEAYIKKVLGLRILDLNLQPKDILKELTILYVEDDSLVADAMLGAFKRICKNVVLASDGIQAVEAFVNISPDIVVSDIQMPKMDGIESCKIIRQLDYRVPIIITTAYSEEQYFQNSLEIKVDRYLVKPIELQKLTHTLVDVATAIKERNLAISYKKQILAREVKDINESLVNEMIDVNPDPIFVLHNGAIAYSNPAFDRMVTGEHLKMLQSGKKKIDDLFVKLDGYMQKCSDYPKLSKVAIKTLKGKNRFFNASFNQISTYMSGVMVILRDITLLEYQKNKYENATVILTELLAKISNQCNVGEHIAISSDNFTPKDKLAAAEFNSVITTADMEELKEHEDDIFDLLESSASLISYSKIGILLDGYSRILRSLDEFNAMSDAIDALVALLLNIGELKTEAYEKLKFYIYNIVCDLSNWREHVFVLKDAIDVHYLDASLLSNCLQAKFTITGFDDSTDDFELF